jgi:2-polyprenyl-3-methyl-5-hydroxy-6-metoxy-1,4-benzoquinol methylase
MRSPPVTYLPRAKALNEFNELEPESVMTTTTKSTAVVSKVWSDFARTRLAPGAEGWRFAMDHPRVRSYIYDKYLNGQDPFGLALSSLLPQTQLTAVEIGCGGGDLAIGLAKSGRFAHIDAYDVSEGAIEVAKSKALDAGLQNINFEVRDCNNISIVGKKYDFAYSSHALHHIEGLEEMFSEVAKVLRDGGLFFADDYIGPSRMQYTDSQIEYMSRALTRLPPEKRYDAWFEDRVKGSIARVPIEDYIRIDPSEGVRAAEIVGIMSQYLYTKTIPMGLSIAYEVFSGIIRNFDPNSESDNALIDMVMKIDSEALEDRDVPVCFGVLIGRK